MHRLNWISTVALACSVACAATHDRGDESDPPLDGKSDAWTITEHGAIDWADPQDETGKTSGTLTAF